MLLKMSKSYFFSNFHIFYFIYLKITKKMYPKNKKRINIIDFSYDSKIAFIRVICYEKSDKQSCSEKCC